MTVGMLEQNITAYEVSEWQVFWELEAEDVEKAEQSNKDK